MVGLLLSYYTRNVDLVVGLHVEIGDLRPGGVNRGYPNPARYFGQTPVVICISADPIPPGPITLYTIYDPK